jgi:hypothetical protein
MRSQAPIRRADRDEPASPPTQSPQRQAPTSGPEPAASARSPSARCQRQARCRTHRAATETCAPSPRCSSAVPPLDTCPQTTTAPNARRRIRGPKREAPAPPPPNRSAQPAHPPERRCSTATDRCDRPSQQAAEPPPATHGRPTETSPRHRDTHARGCRDAQARRHARPSDPHPVQARRPLLVDQHRPRPRCRSEPLAPGRQSPAHAARHQSLHAQGAAADRARPKTMSDSRAEQSDPLERLSNENRRRGESLAQPCVRLTDRLLARRAGSPHIGFTLAPSDPDRRVDDALLDLAERLWDELGYREEVRVGLGEPLDIPEPFGITLDTGPLLPPPPSG